MREENFTFRMGKLTPRGLPANQEVGFIIIPGVSEKKYTVSDYQYIKKGNTAI